MGLLAQASVAIDGSKFKAVKAVSGISCAGGRLNIRLPLPV